MHAVLSRRIFGPILVPVGFVLLAVAGCGRRPSLPPQYAVLGGGAVRKAVGALKGEVVVLNVWATWCQPCREEFPSLVKLDERYRARGVQVIGVSVDEVEDIDAKVKPFVEEIGARFLIWVKAPGDPMDFMDSIDRRLTGAIPETLIFNRNGEVVQVLCKILDGPEKGRVKRRNIIGNAQKGDVLVLLSTEREAKEIKGKK